MKLRSILPFLLICMGIRPTLLAQTLFLKTGNTDIAPFSTPTHQMNADMQVGGWFEGTFYGIISFQDIPNIETQEKLKQKIRLSHYLHQNSYYAAISGDVDWRQLENLGIKSMVSISSEWKYASAEMKESFESFKNANQSELIVHYLPGISVERMRDVFFNLGIVILSDYYLNNAWRVRANAYNWKKLAELPWIYWIEPVSPEPETNNWDERTNHRVPFVEPGASHLSLTGKNVVMGEWDGTGVGTHIDYDYRHVRMEAHSNNSNGAHATHVAGTMLGAGILNPLAKGMAPEALLYSWDFSGNIPVEMDSGAAKQGIEITQNSYSYSSDPCTLRGTYDATSQALDNLVVKYPYLLHVYAAGNSRSSNCMSGGYRTVHSGFQASKNALVAAAVSHLDANSSFHSYGPLMDGRLKPDVSAVGVNVYSTAHNHTYLGGYNGTSMACPGTSGTSALIYELYERTYGTQPAAHVIKGFMCNGADELGRTGPDYEFGYGRINARKSADILEKKQFVVAQVSQGASYSDTIFTKKGLNELKVFLCYDDLPAASSSGRALVNDLDLELRDASGVVTYPWILNPSSPTSNATKGVDTLNNTEQITITAPNSSYYIFKVKGSKIPNGSQLFSVNWSYVDTGITVTYPNGAEHWYPPSSTTYQQIIRWDNYGISGNAKIEYSTDQGKTWKLIVASTPVVNKYYVWSNCPDTVKTSLALIRISGSGYMDVSDSVFHIMKPPALPSAILCDKQVHLYWSALSGAVSYEVYMHDQGKMKKIGTTNNPEFTVRGLQNGVEYWFSTAAVSANGAISERGTAVRFIPNATNRPPVFTAQPSDQRICSGNNANFSVTLNGTSVITSYWQYSDDQGKTWIKTGIDNLLNLGVIKPPAYLNDRWYRHYATNICQSKEYSSIAVLKVDTTITISVPHSEVKACIGQDTLLKALYKGNIPMSYVWYQKSQPTSSEIPVIGYPDRKTFSNVQKSNEGYYLLKIQNACGQYQSPLTYFRVRDPLVLRVNSDTLLCQGQSLNLLATADGGDTISRKLWWSSSDTTVYRPDWQIQPNKSTTWTAGVFDNCSSDTVFASVFVKLRPDLKLTLSNDTIICLGTQVRLNAIAEGGNPNGYKYDWKPALPDRSWQDVGPENATWYYVQLTDGCTVGSKSDSVLVKVLAPVNVEIILPSDTLCYGESAVLKARATGGKSNSYAWRWHDNSRDSILNVKFYNPNTVSVILSDGCTPKWDTASRLVPVFGPLQTKIKGSDSVCHQVEYTYRADMSGGKAPAYRYFWNNIENGSEIHRKEQKSYVLKLRVDDGCSETPAIDSIRIHVFEPLEIYPVFTDSLVCSGQSVYYPVSIMGGRVQNRLVTWPDGTKNNHGVNVSLSNNTKILAVVSDGCSFNDTAIFDIKVRPKLSLTVPSDYRICEGMETSAAVSAQGGLENAHQFFINAQLKNIGDKIIYRGKMGDTARYIFRLSDGCSVPDALDSLVISVDDVNSQFVMSRYDKTLDFRFASFQYTNELYFGDNRFYNGNDEEYSYTYQNYGEYQVCRMVRSETGCVDTTCMMANIYDVFTTSGFNFKVYPTPSLDQVYIEFDKIAGDLSYELYETHGKRLFEKSLTNYTESKIPVDLRPYASGVYWVRLNANGETYSFKLIKQ